MFWPSLRALPSTTRKHRRLYDRLAANPMKAWTGKPRGVLQRPAVAVIAEHSGLWSPDRRSAARGCLFGLRPVFMRRRVPSRRMESASK